MRTSPGQANLIDMDTFNPADDPYEGICVNTYGPESGPHRGQGGMLVAAQLYAGRGKHRHPSARIEPLCPGHAIYEQRWREAVGAIATVEIEAYAKPQ